jgi:predicted phage terminase large subunit-like protein
MALFLSLDCEEAFYGGAGGGAKSETLLIGALQYVDIPGYHALILRRTFRELSLPGALIPRSHDWLSSTDAKWHERQHRDMPPMTWEFPAGATLTFGYLQNEKDKYQYRSSEFQFVGLDELTLFSSSQYTFLFSRLRKLEGVNIPIRMRSGSNPGGPGHEWVKERFIDPPLIGRSDRIFIPAKLSDNPYIDKEQYRKTIRHMDPIERERIEKGDWDVRESGGLFNYSDFVIDDEFRDKVYREGVAVRMWDLAATPKRKDNNPAFTAGVLMYMYDGEYYIEDVVRDRLAPHDVEQLLLTTAKMDGDRIPIYIEQEGGASGKISMDHYQRRVLTKYIVEPFLPHVDKVQRARTLSSAAGQGRVHLRRARWNYAFREECVAFPFGAYKDQVDAASAAAIILNSELSQFKDMAYM